MLLSPDDAPGATTPASSGREAWDRAAATFDEQPDHGLHDPAVRQAWTRLLGQCLPPGRLRVLDAGCGTGSLSVVLAGLGHQVTGIDYSPAMIALARAKAQAEGHAIAFDVMDAGQPGLKPGQFDALVCRHLLWALPEPAQVLRRWAALLHPGGRVVLIEGLWHTGAGLAAQTVLAALPAEFAPGTMLDLSRQPARWGGAVTDERYAIVAERVPPLPGRNRDRKPL